VIGARVYGYVSESDNSMANVTITIPEFSVKPKAINVESQFSILEHKE
jgi:hypothetical protein